MHVEDAAPSRELDEELSSGDRFAFGENWTRFLEVLDDERIHEAERSLRQALGVDDLRGQRFLDLGCGSGLFSLAAMRLGAERVHSIDIDPASVACAQELRRRYFPDSETWTVAGGSALDQAGLARLGTWDVVYSWGVLHHTGDMWQALENVVELVEPGGRLYISIYNDQGRRSRVWRRVKRTYNQLPEALQTPFVVGVMGPREFVSFAAITVRGHPGKYVRMWTEYKRSRGMSRWHDLVDWAGGYPFEVALPHEIFRFYDERGFTLEHLFTAGSQLGCNEYVFRRAR